VNNAHENIVVVPVTRQAADKTGAARAKAYRERKRQGGERAVLGRASLSAAIPSYQKPSRDQPACEARHHRWRHYSSGKARRAPRIRTIPRHPMSAQDAAHTPNRYLGRSRMSPSYKPQA
jgi:hypothetical protein